MQTGELFTVTCQVGLGTKSSLADCLVTVARLSLQQLRRLLYFGHVIF